MSGGMSVKGMWELEEWRARRVEMNFSPYISMPLNVEFYVLPYSEKSKDVYTVIALGILKHHMYFG